MVHRLTVRWHLRQLMATREMFNTSDLVQPLTDRGVVLSREQVYRLVTQTPQRLNLDVLAAVCDILDCQPNDLLEIVPASTAKLPKAKTAGGRGTEASPAVRPVRARVRRPKGS
jgi:DNA-binding Xre family transcriptional regulator